MFNYADPVGGILEATGAIEPYRRRLHSWYTRLGVLPNSAFTILEAFQELGDTIIVEKTGVDWVAFPRTANVAFEQIDSNRFRFQDEYVEWAVEREGGGIKQVTFTTEFPEYFQALAEVGVDALVEGIRQLYPAAAPTLQELFGPGFNPAQATPEGRATRFLSNLANNPWNNGRKGILCLTQQFNTLGALFNLLGHCGVERSDLDPGSVCANVGGFCGDGRNSDPKVCSAAQTLAKLKHGFTLADPAGIRIQKLRGIWKLGGTEIDINDTATNQGVWKVLRNGRRGVLDLSAGLLTIADDAITTGTQVSTQLAVEALVHHAPEDALPAWARTGQESTRVIT